MIFEWDENKNKQNKRKHGISFEEALSVFLDEKRIEKYDINNSTLEEDRIDIIGQMNNMIILFVVYTDRNDKIRLISARKAEADEEAEYYEKTMTLDEVKNLPPLTEKRINEIKNFQNTDFSDCPKQTKEDLKQFRPYYELRAESQKSKNNTIQVNIDTDIIEALKAQGKEYQTFINAILRKTVLG